VEVIRELDLEIRDEEFMVLVGPSGCGKSTALRMIAGLEAITGGTIRIGDRVVNDLPPKDRDIAMVFQSYALYPHMSVRENMDFGLRIKKMKPAEIARRVEDIARILGLETFLARKPRASSPAVSASGWPSAGRSCVSPRSSSSTSSCQTWTPRCGCRCAPRSPICSAACRPRPST
jgi:ABC-type sugar transport system ATPase subunit